MNTHPRKSWWLMALIGALTLALACNLFSPAPAGDISEESTGENPGSAAPTSESNPDANNSESGTGQTESSSDSAEPVEGAVEGQVLDPCLYGKWAVNHESMTEYLSYSMNQGGAIDYFTVSDLQGDLFMAFDENGIMSMSSEDFQVSVLFAPSEDLSIDNIVEIRATGTADYQADGSTLTSKNRDYESVGTDPMESFIVGLTGNDEVIVLEINPGWFNYNGAFVESPADEAHSAPYTCEGNNFTLVPNEDGVVLFERAQ